MEKQYLREFVSTLLERGGKEAVEDFLEGILTIQELEEIPKRLQIVKMLKQGIPQRKIAADLGVGIATVTRGSIELKKGRFKDL